MPKAAAARAPTKRATKKKAAPKIDKLEGAIDMGTAAAVYVRLSDLTEWARNPRVNDAAIPSVMASIKEFGFGAPLLARKANGELIAGHTRIRAAMQLGLKYVPVRYLDLSEKQAHKLALADNKLGEIATWDDSALLAILHEYEPDERVVAGWDEDDMRALERRVLGASGSDGTVGEDEPGPLPKVAITRPGDVWQLGRHRLICGDSTSPAVLARLLEGRKVGLLATDPPYGVTAIGGTKDARDPQHKRGGRKDIAIENDDLKPDSLEAFLRDAFEAASPHLAPGASWYVWFASTVARPVFAAVEALGGYRHELVWVKSQFVFGRCDYHYRHEPVLYGWTPGAGHTWLGTRDQSSVFEVAYDNHVRGGSGTLVAGEAVHPSVKPVELWAIPIRNHLGADGALLDLFAGTGPAFSAAEQLGRTCYGVELDPRYCDVIVARWEALTQGRGVRLEGGGETVEAEPAGATSRPPKGRKRAAAAAQPSG